MDRLFADLTKRVDEASAMLNSMMDDIHQNLFVNGAVADVTGLALPLSCQSVYAGTATTFTDVHTSHVSVGQPSDVTEAAAIATAVASRMNQLDEAFLIALGAYCNAAQQQGNITLAGIYLSAARSLNASNAELHTKLHICALTLLGYWFTVVTPLPRHTATYPGGVWLVAVRSAELVSSKRCMEHSYADECCVALSP